MAAFIANECRLFMNAETNKGGRDKLEATQANCVEVTEENSRNKIKNNATQLKSRMNLNAIALKLQRGSSTRRQKQKSEPEPSSRRRQEQAMAGRANELVAMRLRLPVGRPLLASLSRGYPAYLVLIISSLLLVILHEQTSQLVRATPIDYYTINEPSMEELTNKLQQQFADFDPTAHKNVLDAIRAHRDLREFERLCDLEAIKQVISLSKMPLTVFAPIDGSMSDLLAQSGARSINLDELAKNHIVTNANGLEESAQYPVKLDSAAQLPLYLSRQPAAAATPGDGPNHSGALFVNNARILATYLISVDSDNFHTLHIIDQPLLPAYQTRLRKSWPGANASQKSRLLVQPLGLDDLLGPAGNAAAGLHEFYERFADVKTNQPQADLYHTRQLKGASRLTRDQLNLERLGQLIRDVPELRGLLHQTGSGSGSLNTYFLPINSDELRWLAAGDVGLAKRQLAGLFRAHTIPGQVLFSRALGLGKAHPTAGAANASQPQGFRVSLSLMKALPEARADNKQDSGARYLAKPLMVQARCQTSAASAGHAAAPDSGDESGSAPGSSLFPRAGLTSAEVVLANIPLNNGVLHLIRKPLVVPTNSLLDYFNDNDSLMSELATARGSQAAAAAAAGSQTEPAADAERPPEIQLNRFRELVARERSLLANSLGSDRSVLITALVPSDEAFSRLRYDLKALILGDEALIPAGWDSAYRQSLVGNLIRRHIILNKSISSDQMAQGLRETNEEQIQVRFRLGAPHNSAPAVQWVESANSRARVLQRDLLATNGILHVIDRVLGEEEETLASLLEANQIRLGKQAGAEAGSQDLLVALDQLIQTNLLRSGSGSGSQPQLSAGSSGQQPEEKNRLQESEHSLIRDSIQQYLDELEANKRQLELLANSVNISHQLMTAASRQATGSQAANLELFKRPDGEFTYFVPSDLAWVRLQLAYPALYKPLGLSLNRCHEPEGSLREELVEPLAGNGIGEQPQSLQAANRSTRTLELESLFSRILDRHLVRGRKVSPRDMEKLDSLNTIQDRLQLVQDTSRPNDKIDELPAASHSMKKVSFKSLKLSPSSSGKLANVVQMQAATNGYLYVIDNVLIREEDVELASQVRPAPSAFSLSMTQNILAEYVRALQTSFNWSMPSIVFIGILAVTILIFLIIAVVLGGQHLYRKRSNSLRELEVSTNSSVIDSNSPSITKNL